MVVPGFIPEALDEGGAPRWLSELATRDPNHLLHVVRGLDPQAAMEFVGGRVVRRLAPNELPTQRPDEWSTVMHAAVGADRMTDLLVAGQHDGWTFVYDASGVTGDTADHQLMAVGLSQDGRTAATSIFTINADESFGYAEDGEILCHITEPYDAESYDEETPEVIRPAVLAAIDDEESDHPYYINMRIVCALAGLTFTPAEMRDRPLLIGECVSSTFYDLMAKMSQLRAGLPQRIVPS